jgi:hypothetical protein
MTGGDATGGNDVFNGKNRIFWWLAGQDPLAGSNGRSTINWAWCVNWAGGDNCHTIKDGSVTGNSVSRYSVATVHTFSGAHVHTGDWPFVNTIGQGGFAEGSYTIDHDSNGQASVVLVSSHKGSSGATSTANINTALPDIVQDPTAPTSLTATRISDTQIDLAWTNTSTSHHEYASVKVYRSTNGGSYANIVTLGVVTSYSDTTTSADNKYTYKVQAVNAAGTADSSASSAVYTTPDAPGTPVASKLGSGNIQLDWTNNVGYGDSAYTTRIEHSANGGAFSELTSVSGGVATYEHVSPNPAQTHTYKIRARSTTGSLNSSYSSNSNVIVLLTTASAPTGLSPSGVAVDATEDTLLSWTHNPTDGTPQKRYQLQHDSDGGASYTTVGPTTTATQSYNLAGGTYANGLTITWRVETAGENNTLSSYSSVATFTTSARPTATLDDLSDYNSSALVAGFTYFQAQSSLQATWRAYLYDSDDNLLESKSGTTEVEVTFSTPLSNATTYTVKVYVTSAAGLESLVEDQEFTTDFLPPADTFVSASYDVDSGSMILTVTADDAVEDVTSAVATVDVQRKVNDGAWVTIISGLTLTDEGDGLTAIVTDHIPTINGTNTYRVVAYSAVPTSGLSAEEVEVTTESGWCFLNTSTLFSTYAKFRAKPQIQAKTSRAKALYHFAGRIKPVQLTGEAQDLVLSISGMLINDSSTPEEFEDMAYVDDVVCWRDPTGRRIFASIGDVTTSRESQVFSNVSFGLVEVDYDE